MVVDPSKISQQVTPLSFLCHTPEMIIAQEVNPYTNAGFNVKTPNGLQYRFDVGPSIAETNQADFGRQYPNSAFDWPVLFRHNAKPWSKHTISPFENKINKLQYLPSIITDNNGNWIKFEYTNALPTNTSKYYGYFVPKKITTSDGREVSFEYYSAQKIWSSRYSVPLVRFIKSGGRTWEYIYNSKKELKTVILPEASMTWEYAYSSINPQDAFVAIGDSEHRYGVGSSSKHKPRINRITTPTGVNYGYTYQQRWIGALGIRANLRS